MTTPEDIREITIDLDVLQQVRRYRDLGRTIKHYTDERARVREWLVKVLDGFDTGMFNGYPVVTVARNRPRRFDYEAFSEANPGLYEQYRVEAEKEEIRLIVGRELPGDTNG